MKTRATDADLTREQVQADRITDAALETLLINLLNRQPFTVRDLRLVAGQLAAEREHTLELQAEVAELKRQVHEANQRMKRGRKGGWS